jgi:hypothetical protein
VTLGRMPREEPSAGCSGRAEPTLRSAPHPKFCEGIATECDRTSRKDDQLLMLPTSVRCKNLTALRNGPDLSRPQRSPRSGPYISQARLRLGLSDHAAVSPRAIFSAGWLLWLPWLVCPSWPPYCPIDTATRDAVESDLLSFRRARLPRDDPRPLEQDLVHPAGCIDFGRQVAS